MPLQFTDARLGRLFFESIFGDLGEKMGMGAQSAGRWPSSGEPRPVELAPSFAVDFSDTVAAARVRRQAIALINNSAACRCIYFDFAPYSEVSGWLFVGSAEMQPMDQAGFTLQRWKLILGDTFLLGRGATYLDARYLLSYDLRNGLAARDYLGMIHSVAFAGTTRRALHFFPVGATKFQGAGNSAMGTRYGLFRRSLAGDIPFAVDRPHHELVSYIQDPTTRYSDADVILFDRRGSLVTGNTPFTDTFAVDNLASYVYKETGQVFTVSGGALQMPVNSGSTSVIRQDIVTSDQEEIVKVTPGLTTATSKWAGIILRAQSSSLTLLLFQVTFNAAGATTLELFSCITGTYVSRANVGGGPTTTTGVARWLRAYVVGDVFTGEIWTTDPVLGGAPAKSVVFNVSGISQLKAGIYGSPGVRSDTNTNAITGWTFDDLKVNPSDPAPPVWYPVGWEEVYGPTQPLFDTTDMPVMGNGLCRVRTVGAGTGIPNVAIDSAVIGAGYVERGRVGFWMNDAFWNRNQPGNPSWWVEEWSPERAVVGMRMVMQLFATQYNVKVYITLERGWTGPRIEMYSDTVGGTTAQPNLRYTPVVPGLLAYSNGMTDLDVSPDASAFFTTLGANEPWVSVLPMTAGHPTMNFAIMASSNGVTTRDDTSAYGGATRKSVTFLQTTGADDYIGVRFGTCEMKDGSTVNPPMPAAFEAETYRVASGTTSQVADGTGSVNGQVVKEVQTAATNNTILFANPPLPTGLYTSWVRIKVVDASTTFSIKSDMTDAATTTTTSTAWAWVKVGDINHTTQPSDTRLTIWRSAGAGVNGILIDRVAYVPTQRRADPITNGQPTDWTGAYDLGTANLSEAHQLPGICER